MSRTVEFNLTTLKQCIKNDTNNNEIGIRYNMMIELFQATYEEQMELFRELIIDKSTSLEHLVVLYNCIKIFGPDDTFSIVNKIRYQGKRRKDNLVKVYAHRISFCINLDLYDLIRSDLDCFTRNIIEDLRYLISLDLEDNILFRILREVEKGHYKKNKTMKITHLIIEIVKPEIINKLFTEESTNYEHPELYCHQILEHIYLYHQKILSDEAFRAACNRTKKIRRKGIKRMVNILESERVTIQDVEIVSSYTCYYVKDVSHLIDLFKKTEKTCKRMIVLGLIISSGKIAESIELLKFLENEEQHKE